MQNTNSNSETIRERLYLLADDTCTSSLEYSDYSKEFDDSDATYVAEVAAANMKFDASLPESGSPADIEHINSLNQAIESLVVRDSALIVKFSSTDTYKKFAAAYSDADDFADAIVASEFASISN